MVYKETPGELFVDILIYVIMIILAISCLLPLLIVLAISFSNRDAAMAGKIGLWPVGFTTLSYKFLMDRPAFLKALVVSLKRIVIGVPYNMLMILFTAYPLSKTKRQLRGRNIYAWYFVFTMLFGGGLIPTYMTIKTVGLIDKFLVLIVPGGVLVWNIILMMNFFRSVPQSLEEVAFVDGAGYVTTLFKIYIPLSLPAMATISLFTMVAQWNAWFDGLIYMTNSQNYPLQTYIYTIITSASKILDSYGAADPEMLKYIQTITDKSIKSAQIFLAALPILCVYPFLQKYFMTGIKLGSVKE
ncbi:MAG: carbohydrate ABC transporter permease [Syntrophomonadaceae bacterium]|nr:carbohydrate ABC transporter permease [Syntrophomonadaceae bacterium]